MDFSNKIIKIEELSSLREKYRDLKLSLCHGVFDIVHIGHLLHFQKVAANCDKLIVSITSDKFIAKKRSFEFNEKLRLIQLASIEYVDYVLLVEDTSAIKPISMLKPDFYVKGDEYKKLETDISKNIFLEKKEVERYGGKLIFTEEETYSSTKLGYFLKASTEADQNTKQQKTTTINFVNIGNKNVDLNKVKKTLANMMKLKVAVVGETIIDKWSYNSLLGVSNKSRCLAVKEEKLISQNGGSFVIASHLASLGVNVSLYSNIENIPGKLPDNINYYPQKNLDLIIKERFLDFENNKSLFERQIIPEFKNNEKIELKSCYDLILISDFGHGLIKDGYVKQLKNTNPKSKIAAMAQANTANLGRNLIRKNMDADFLFLNTKESQLELQNFSTNNIQELITELRKKFPKNELISVTGGENGSVFEINNKIYNIPTVTETKLETVGCGDIYFCLSACALTANNMKNINVAGAIGSMGAAYIASGIGNHDSPTYDFFINSSKIIF